MAERKAWPPDGAPRRAYLWHRRLGLASILLVVLLAATGVLLNHGGRLGLDRTYVTAPWLLDWYGIGPEAEPVSYPIGGRWLTWLDGGLYLDGRPLAAGLPEITGAVMLDGMIAVAAPESLMLLTPAGERIEQLTSASLPARIVAIGRGREGRIVLRTPDGWYAAAPALDGWRAEDAGPVSWAGPAPPPDPVLARVLESYRGRGLPWERVVRDLHSGRILGAWGPYLMDAAALALLVLAATGLYNRFARHGRSGGSP